MSDIADPIHQPKPLVAEPCASEVVLDDYGICGDACSFAQQKIWLLRVVKYIDEHDHVVRSICVRELSPVKLADWDGRMWARADLDTRWLDFRASTHDRTCKRAIATTDVEQRARIPGQDLLNARRECAHSPSEDESAVQGGRDASKRAIGHGDSRAEWRMGDVRMTRSRAGEQLAGSANEQRPPNVQ